jgi:prefoldin subunit 5
MKYLTFLDYPTLEAKGRTFEAQLKEKDREIEGLKRQIAQITIDVSEIQKMKQDMDDLKEAYRKSKEEEEE